MLCLRALYISLSMCYWGLHYFSFFISAEQLSSKEDLYCGKKEKTHTFKIFCHVNFTCKSSRQKHFFHILGIINASLLIRECLHFYSMFISINMGQNGEDK